MEEKSSITTGEGPSLSSEAAAAAVAAGEVFVRNTLARKCTMMCLSASFRTACSLRDNRFFEEPVVEGEASEEEDDEPSFCNLSDVRFAVSTNFSFMKEARFVKYAVGVFIDEEELEGERKGLGGGEWKAMVVVWVGLVFV